MTSERPDTGLGPGSLVAIETRIRNFFDAVFYSRRYPDVRPEEAFKHYLEFGWQEGRLPNSWFGTVIQHHSCDPGTPDFLDFLLKTDDRTLDSYIMRYRGREAGHVGCEACRIMRGEFDGEYYRRRYGDIADEADALSHFCDFGWQEARSPNDAFDLACYLDAYPDVRDARTNGFVHYLQKGRKEGRNPRALSPETTHILQALWTPLVRQSHYKRAYQRYPVADARTVLNALRAMLPDGALEEITLSISHDDAIHGAIGGISLIVRRELSRGTGGKSLYLHLSPAIPAFELVPSFGTEAAACVLTLDPQTQFCISIGEVLQLFGMLNPCGDVRVDVRVHCIFGWAVADIEELIAGLAAEPATAEENRGKATARRRRSRRRAGSSDGPAVRVTYVAHDYSPICRSFNLLRDDVEYCDAPHLASPPSASACNDCVHGRNRAVHLPEMRRFFERLDPVIEYPSETVREIYHRYDFLKSRAARVVPHASLAATRRVPARPASGGRLSRTRRLRLAYCGTASTAKGWYCFDELVKACGGLGENFAFFQFSARGRNSSSSVVHVETGLDADKGTSSLPDLLRAHRIDCALLWSLWPETFGLTMVECVEAGVPILTNRNSGNIAATVASRKLGWVLDDLTGLKKLLFSGSFAEQCDAAKARLKAISVEMHI